MLIPLSPQSKKGQVFMIVLFLLVLVGLSSLYIILLSKGKGFDRDIGERQFAIWRAYDAGQHAIYYAELSASVAMEVALRKFAEEGGGVTACGDYAGYQLWNNGDKRCMPPVNARMTQIFDEELYKYLSQHVQVIIPGSNFVYDISETAMTATAREPLMIRIYDNYGVISSGVVASPASTGVYAWPSRHAVVTSCKGARDVKEGSKEHKGIDIRAYMSDPVFAIADGTAKLGSGPLGEVIIDHGSGLKSRYLHNSRILVANGAAVKKGDPIALAGNKMPGMNLPVHIHLEILKDNTAVNPFEGYFPTAGVGTMKTANCYYNRQIYAAYGNQFTVVT